MTESGSVATSGDVLVVGAGPVGLVAACELARQGICPVVVEALPTPTAQSRAVGVHARTQELLAVMGVLPAIEDKAQAQSAIEIRTGSDGNRVLAHLDITGIPSRYPRILNLPQPETEAALRALAETLGIVIHRGVALTSLQQDDDGVAVTLQNGDRAHEARFGWVVGTDGARSAVRSSVGSSLVGSFQGQTFVLADVDVETELSPDTTRMFSHPDGIAGIFPMKSGRVRLMFVVPAPPAGTAPTLEEVRRLVAERMGGRLTITGTHWLTYFEVHHAQVPQYRVGRVLLAGDAAHVHSPAGGQGMNTGIQDAGNLAWKLALVAQGLADPLLLDSYHAERHPVGERVVRQTTKLTDLLTTSGTLAAARNVALGLAGHITPVGSKIAAELTEVALNYHDSTGVGSGPHSKSMQHNMFRPGSHLPDPDGLTDATGHPRRLPELLRHRGHLLLTTDLDPANLTSLRRVLGRLGTVVQVVPDGSGQQPDVLVDAAGSISGKHGLGQNGVALIRPDGYVGFADTHAGASALREHLIGRLHITQTPAGA